ncbi:MAG: hypothetical protein QOE61_487 [Micromonosporaceae bacterium]|jgi:hypothetical protein|nr:hypothetical protein [Micromonosporaceae bacterium]
MTITVFVNPHAWARHEQTIDVESVSEVNQQDLTSSQRIPALRQRPGLDSDDPQTIFEGGSSLPAVDLSS